MKTKTGDELGQAQLELELGFTLIKVCCIILIITNYHYISLSTMGLSLATYTYLHTSLHNCYLPCLLAYLLSYKQTIHQLPTGHIYDQLQAASLLSQVVGVGGVVIIKLKAYLT